MADSIHTARWLSQISSQNWDVHLFDFNEGTVTTELVGASTYTVHPPPSETGGLINWKSDYPFRRGAGFAKRNFPSFLKTRLFPDRVDKLAALIQELKPDIIHSLEMQHESYPLLDVRGELGGSFPAPWIYSSWGSDIYHFIHFEDHQRLIKAVLETCDYHISDCRRDVVLAVQNGFNGESLGVFPVAGSYEVDRLRKSMALGQVSRRRSIAVKGYEHWAGRALTAVEALSFCADALDAYCVEFYLADGPVREAAKNLSKKFGIDVKIVEQVNNSEILKLLGRSRIGIGLSISDGTPNTMLESMIMGAFPIQSDTISTGEWITDAVNGFLVPPEDSVRVADAIMRALADDELVDSASETNHALMLQRVDYSVLNPKIIELYEKVYAKIGQP